MTPSFHLDHIEMKISEGRVVNENKHRSDVVITVKSTPLEEVMKDWSAEEKERMAQAVFSNSNFKLQFKQPE
ncbi:TPA: hypothetical protein N2N40_002467 [Citrobacter freundii]|nr:hypothetical protein [Citrobacter freundii]